MNFEENNSGKIQAEARFQDQRLHSQAGGKQEPRDKFYFLTEDAFIRYQDLINRFAPNSKALVVGCSIGGVTPLIRLGADATGVDISPEAIHRLNRAISTEGLQDRGRAVLMNAENLDFPEKSFDLICCTGVLHHLDTDAAAKSWARALKESGHVVMMEPLAWHPLVALYRFFTPSMRTPDEHPLKPHDFVILNRYYRSVEFTGFVLTSIVAAPFAVLGLDLVKNTLNRILGRLDRLLLRLFPFLRYFCWTSVIVLSEPNALNES